MNIARESIFVSAVRSFFKAFSSLIGILVGLIIIGIAFFFVSRPYAPEDKTTMIIAADAEGKRDLLPESTPVILRINIHGFIGSREFNTKTVKTMLLDSREGVLKHDRVKAILLHLNTPGGNSFDSNDIYEQLVEYKNKYHIPIYAYIDGLCASGGMLISAAADKVYSSPTGIIGSIGVIMGPAFNIYDLMEKVGVKALTLTKGKDKDMLSPFRPWEPGEDQSLRDIMDYEYETFVDIMTKARTKLNKNKLIHVYGAQVFAPPKAQELGYIDEAKSSYNEALSDLVETVEIDKEKGYQVVEIKVLHPVLSDIIEGKSPIISGKMKHEFQIGADFPLELINRPLYLYAPALQRATNNK
jgi:protease-4